MIVDCPNCQSHFAVADRLLGPAGRKLKCSACGLVWHFTPPDDEMDALDGMDGMESADEPAPARGRTGGRMPPLEAQPEYDPEPEPEDDDLPADDDGYDDAGDDRRPAADMDWSDGGTLPLESSPRGRRPVDDEDDEDDEDAVAAAEQMVRGLLSQELPMESRDRDGGGGGGGGGGTGRSGPRQSVEDMVVPDLENLRFDVDDFLPSSGPASELGDEDGDDDVDLSYDGGDDLPEFGGGAVRGAQARNRRRRTLALAVGATLLLVIGGLGAAWWQRDLVLSYWPDGRPVVDRIVDLIGGDDRRQLAIDSLIPSLVHDGGVEILKMTGTLRNTGDAPVRLPSLRLEVFSAQAVLKRSEPQKPPVEQLDAGAKAAFSLRLEDPPKDTGASVRVVLERH